MGLHARLAPLTRSRNITWAPLATLSLAIVLLLTGWLEEAAIAILLLSLICEAAFFRPQLNRVRQWRQERVDRLTEDPTALDDVKRTTVIRRRIRVRLTRRALGVIFVVPGVGLVGVTIVFEAADFWKHFPVILEEMFVGAVVIAVLGGMAWHVWKRFSDLFGAPVIFFGQITRATVPEEADELHLVMGLDSAELTIDVVAVRRLTRKGGREHASQQLGNRTFELAAGAKRVLPRSGPVALVCSARGRCIGRLGQFDRASRKPSRLSRIVGQDDDAKGDSRVLDELLSERP
jgi:hypothetical protein